MSVIVIALPAEPWTTVVPIALLFPVLLWIAARCRPVFAAAAAFIVTLAIVWTTTIGIGHFGDPGLPMADRVLAARAGILAVALCAYVLAALFAERRQHEAALAESEARLQEALTAGAVTTFVWDVGTRSSQRSANAAQILGFDPTTKLYPEQFSLTSTSGRPRAVQGARARCHPRTPCLYRHLPLQAPRRPGSLARGNSKGRIRPVGTPCTPQGPHSRRHRAQAIRGPTKPAHRRARSSRQESAGARCCRRQGHAPRQRFARRVHSSTGSAHTIHGRCPRAAQPRIAGMASTSPNSSAVSLRPTERTQTPRSAARISRSRSR